MEEPRKFIQSQFCTQRERKIVFRLNTAAVQIPSFSGIHSQYFAQLFSLSLFFVLQRREAIFCEERLSLFRIHM